MTREPGPVFRLLLATFAVAVVLLVAPSARALALVPMCGERAETIAAPPTILPSKDQVLERAAPCPSDEGSRFDEAPSDAPRPTPSNLDESPQRACPCAHSLPIAPRAVAPRPVSELPPHAALVLESIYRPPRPA